MQNKIVNTAGVSFRLLLSIILPVLFLVSCSPPDEQAHPLFRKAENLKNKGEYEKAAQTFEQYLLVNGKSATTHYKLGEIYNDNLDDPFMTIYHFREYLHYNPDTPDRESVESWITAAEEEFARRVDERNPNALSMDEVARLRDYNRKYRECLIKLKDQNALLRRKLTGVSGGRGDAVSGSGNFVIGGSYTVKPGDSLSKISRELYGSSKYHTVIFDANRDVLPSESVLKVGQKLRIPQIPGKTLKTGSGKKIEKGLDGSNIPDVITE